MRKSIKQLDEKGMTLLESLVAFFITSLFVGILLSISLVGMSKTTYLNNDSEIIRFEQGIVKWFDNDYRENRIRSINVDFQGKDTESASDFCPESLEEDAIWGDQQGNKIIFDVGHQDLIVYENKSNGFYRTEYINTNENADGIPVLNDRGDTVLLTEEPVECIRYDSENKIIELYFNVYSDVKDDFKKSIIFRLVK